jgi:hypothetical protein
LSSARPEGAFEHGGTGEHLRVDHGEDLRRQRKRPGRGAARLGGAQRLGSRPGLRRADRLGQQRGRQVLADLASKNGQALDYKRSIVDLLKLLDLDSSLQARKQLADELHYTGDKEDSATMNVWLHKQVIKKVAENGGKVPEDLKHA